MNSTFTNNYAHHDGGAVYSNSTATNGMSIHSVDLVTRNSSFCYNNASGRGAAIYSDHNELVFESSVFDKNAGTGAIVSLNEKMTAKNCSVSNNLGPLNMDYFAWGGGIICEDGSMLLENSRVNGNHAHYDGIWGYGGDGGGMLLNRSDVTLNNTTVDGNVAFAMAGIFSVWNNLVVNGGSISNNIATSGGVGGIYTDGHTTLNGVILRGNNAEASGGAILAGGVLNITGRTLILENVVNEEGAGIFNPDDVFIDDGVVISGNIAKKGAGIHNSVGNVTIGHNVVISNNTAIKGAGIYNEGYVAIYGDNLYHEGTIVLNGTSITGNNATYGSAIYNEGNATIIGCELKDNPASIGGSIWNTEHLVIRDSTIDGLKMCCVG